MNGREFAWLRHERAGLRHRAGSDWDVAVEDPAAAGVALEREAGPPDLRVERQYVTQRFYPWGQLDFLAVFEWNGIEYLDRNRFWSGVGRGEDGLRRPRLAHDAFICWMTQLLWGGRYRKKYDGILAAAWTEDREEFSDCLEVAFGPAWSRRLGRMVAAGRPGEAAADAPELRRALAWRAFRRAPGETLWRQATHWWREFKHHAKPPHPWVAVLGPDGSGKSTVVEGLTAALAARRLKVEMLHWRPQLLWNAASVPGGIVTDPHAKPPRGMVVSAAKLFFLGAEWWVAHLGRLRHFRAKDRIVVSDRYYGDLLVDQRRYRYGAPLSWARAAFRAYPKPDRVVFLLTDAATIRARKQEVTPEELDRQLKAYRDYAAGLGDKAVIVDAGRPLEEVVAAVTEAVLEACRARRREERGAPELLPPIPGCGMAGTVPVALSQPGFNPPSIAPQPPAPDRLRVLVSAYACSPDRGAEANVAWNLVRELSARHELWVMTRENNRAAIEAAGGPWVGRVRWVYVDPPRSLSFWRRGRHGVHLFYVWWQWLARGRAKALLQEQAFDVFHHVTFGTYIVPSPLSDLGVPLVFGPVGGGEQTPPGLEKSYGWGGKWEEWQRVAAHWLVERLGFLRHWYHANAWTLAATPVTEEALRKLGVERVSVMPQSATGGDAVERFAAANASLPDSPPGVLRLVSASRLVHWKAIHLALEAVAEARAGGLDVRLTVLQEGPEERALKRLSRDLGLTDAVEFTGRLPELDQVFERMSGADALLHPALHEAFGQACLETLTLGVPVICLDWGGPGMIVDESCGYKVPPGSHDETLAGLAAAIRALAEDRAAGRDFRVAAKARAAAFRWEDMAADIEKVYGRVSGNRDSGGRA
ncbi:glycosyltransferase [Luteolibacter marinus]|uniref:glycosyltransferase n=1 Tax=Luteolibacter marinus TaxID=2776705 RepID=UPI001866045A